MGEQQNQRKRITGTHVYTMLRCPRAVALDLHEDKDKRRPLREAEEFARQRGRELEARLVAELGYVEPDYPRRDFAAGAAATERMLRDGVPGVSQGVLLSATADQLGIPDLLRKAEGPSALGDHHYVVGDIKSSGRPRSDQVLQVAFYSRLLANLQDRPPEYGYLILKDGHEERFDLTAIDAAMDDVLERVCAVREDPDSERPFLSAACGHCHWSELCVPELEAKDDLSLLQGMTRGLRTVLERVGFMTAASLSDMAVEPTARRSHLEATLLRRLKKASTSRADGRPLLQKNGGVGQGSAALVHMLIDHYAERVLFFGLLYPAEPQGQFHCVCPDDREQELAAFLALLQHVPDHVPLLHYGEALPRWFTEAGCRHPRTAAVEGRFVNLQKRLRGAAVYPGPVFSMADHVHYVLGVDPHREGEADAAACWIAEGQEERLASKGRSDLVDLSRVLHELCREEEASGPVA
ncbi:MAG: TM0106 family RecB-like putative nuclease [Planctomycetota bacterium]|jgi:uncharacterized protein